MKTDKFIKWLVGAVVLMVGVMGLLLFKLTFSVNPEKSYFVKDSSNKMDYFKWEIDTFQPVYLYSVIKNDKYYFRVAYRDLEDKFVQMDILIGQNGTESATFVRVATANGVVNIDKLSDYKKYISLGKRIRVTYIRNVLKRSDGSTPEIIEPTDLNVSVICNINPQNCLPIKMARENPEIFWNFPVTGNFPKEKDFPAMLIYTDLITNPVR